VTRLFGYGTFRKTAWRDAILARTYPAQPATLRGYRRIAVASGYLSLRETVFDVRLVARRADRSRRDRLADRRPRGRKSPRNRRAAVVVNTMGGAVEAVAYFCSRDDGATPVDDDCYALISDAAVEASIETFGPAMRRLRRDGEAPSDDGE